MLQETVHIARWAKLPEQVPIRPLVGAAPVHWALHFAALVSVPLEHDLLPDNV